MEESWYTEFLLFKLLATVKSWSMPQGQLKPRNSQFYWLGETEDRILGCFCCWNMKGKSQKGGSQREDVSNSEYKLCPHLQLTPGPRMHEALSKQPRQGWKNRALKTPTSEAEFTAGVQSSKLQAETKKNRSSPDEHSRI